jgi:uncharacterized protein YggE
MNNTDQTSRNNLNLSLDLRVVSALLLLALVTTLFVWKPWASEVSNSRTITVTGEAKITEAPDEYSFMPTYEFKDTAKEAALSSLTKKSDEIVKKLKELGVADNKIKTSSDGYDYRMYYFDDSSKQFTYTLRPTVTINSKELAQKVQDYLSSTAPSGQVSPIAGFSTSKKKTLESKARDEATKDARAKADQSAKNLGFKVFKVQSIQDGTNYSGIVKPMMMTDSVAGAQEAKITSNAVQPGENDLTYSVTVIYYIR